MKTKTLVLAKANPSKHGDNRYVCTIGYDIERKEWLRIWRIKPEYKYSRWDILLLDLERTSDKREETHAIRYDSEHKTIGQYTKQQQQQFLNNSINKHTTQLDYLGRSCGIIKPKDIEYEVTDEYKCYMNYNSGGSSHRNLIKDQGFNLLIKKTKKDNKPKQYLLRALYNLDVQYIMIGTHARFGVWMLIALYWGYNTQKPKNVTIERFLE